MAKKISNTKVGIVSPITTYADGKEAQDVASQYVRIFPANVVGGSSNISTSLDDEDISLEFNLETDTETQEETDSKKEDIFRKKAPLLSDIELVSKTISYDASGVPSITAIFKVRNSSGQSIKSVNARVQV